MIFGYVEFQNPNTFGKKLKHSMSLTFFHDYH